LRRLTLLHAHGLIAKVFHPYRWQVTAKGRRILTALLAARHADTDKLISLWPHGKLIAACEQLGLLQRHKNKGVRLISLRFWLTRGVMALLSAWD
jgi:hypothetical protein